MSGSHWSRSSRAASATRARPSSTRTDRTSPRSSSRSAIRTSTPSAASRLPVFRYRQQDSRFEGLEAELEIPLGAGAFTLELTGEYLRGRLEGGGDLPRMPPFGLGAGLRYDEGAWSASLAVNHHFEQDRVAELELPTDAYTLLDADLLFRPGWVGDGVLLFLRGRNLLDEDARLHTSPLKDRLPLPGRSIGAGVRVEFGQ